jgi:hypothetical protein
MNKSFVLEYVVSCVGGYDQVSYFDECNGHSHRVTGMAGITCGSQEMQLLPYNHGIDCNVI